MMRNLLTILFLVIPAHLAFSQTGNTCSDPLPFCTGTNYEFPAGVNSGDGQIGPDYGCLGSEPNPVWYFMQVEDPGLIQIYMVGTSNPPTPTNDIDFICYGPFSSLNNVCTGQLTAANIVDCSYLPDPAETVNIPNAQSGEYYLLLITNFSNDSCNIIFSQSNEGSAGAGSTDCGILSNSGNNGPICQGDTLILTGDSQSGNTSYLWYQLPDFTNAVERGLSYIIPNAQPSDAGQYAYVVIDLDNNESDTSFTDVVIYSLPVASFSPVLICDDEPVNFQNETILSDVFGSVQQSWFWDFDHLEEDNISPAVSNQENPVHVFPAPGNYNVYFWVESNNGCRDSIFQEVKVVDPPKPSFTYELFCFQEVFFSNTSQEGTFPFETVNWNFGDNSGTSTTFDSLLTYVYGASGSYNVSLVITDTAGCISDTTLAIEVIETPGFDELPNVLTPNGDDINDSYSFLPIHDDCYEYTFTLFNRWGNKVFATERSDKGFQGISNLGSGLNDGVYYWVLSANRKIPSNETEIVKKGTLTIAGSK